MSLRTLKRKSKKKHDPAGAQSHFDRGNREKAAGNLDRATSLYRRALKLDPGHGESHNNLANAFHLAGRLKEALPHYQAACRLLGEIPEVRYNYGTALYEAGRTDEAISELKTVLALEPDYAEAHAALGVAFQSRGDLTQAAASLREAIRLRPGYQEAHRYLGLVIKDQGDIPGAVRQFNKLLDKYPADALTRYILSKYQRYSTTKEADLETPLALLANPATSDEDRIFIHFTLGKILDDLGQYPEAFHHYSEGNRRRLATLAPGVIASGINLKTIRQIFTPRLFQRLSAAGNNSELPVFIIGMPRSGTTLVEQICAGHSAVRGRGELKTLGELIRKNLKRYPGCLTAMAPQQLKETGEEYLAELQKNKPDGIIRLTDKMPTNFIELGLIRLLFPRARIIHCVRDPLDTCLSNFFQNFEEGNEFSFELKALGFYYRKYRELMEFWREVLPGDILEVRYENLVVDFENEAGRLIRFLGLEWQENCLTFFKNRRAIHTSSDWQVRQPIYSKSVERWKNYAEELAPLRRALESRVKLL